MRRYPLNFKWWQVWRSYVDFDSEEEAKAGGPRPDAIDNSSLCKEGFAGVLRFGLVRRRVSGGVCAVYHKGANGVSMCRFLPAARGL